MREPVLLDDEQREDDGRRAARAEPAEEGRRVGAPRAGPEHRDRDRQHAHQREAEHRVERDLPGEIAERRAEQHRAEDDERRPRRGRAPACSMRYETSPPLCRRSPPKTRAADERGDEARSSELPRRCRTRGARRRAGRSGAMARRRGGARRRGRRRRPRARPRALRRRCRTRSSPRRVGGVAVPDRALLGLGDRERDRNGGTQIPSLRPLSTLRLCRMPRRQARRGDDRLTEGGVGGREDDREHERLRPARGRRAGRARPRGRERS